MKLKWSVLTLINLHFWISHQFTWKIDLLRKNGELTKSLVEGVLDQFYLKNKKKIICSLSKTGEWKSSTGQMVKQNAKHTVRRNTVSPWTLTVDPLLMTCLLPLLLPIKCSYLRLNEWYKTCRTSDSRFLPFQMTKNRPVCVTATTMNKKVDEKSWTRINYGIKWWQILQWNCILPLLEPTKKNVLLK